MFRRILSIPIRGGKKGKGKGEEVKIEATTDIINIYKDGKDPEKLPKSEYPPWLFELVDIYYTHPCTFAERMYKGEKVSFRYLELKRLWKFAKRNDCVIKNRYIDRFILPKDYEKLLPLEIPGAEDTDVDQEDTLGPLSQIAFGAPPQPVIEECLKKIRIELGIIKREAS